MSDNVDKQMLDWHSGFYAAAKFEFRNEPFSFEREYPLNKMPICIDVLINSKPGYVSENNIARIFRRVNVIEYKSPKDELTYVQFFKTLSYASLYIGNNLAVDVLPKDVTMSIFRDTYPKALFEYLRANAYEIIQYRPGIYYVKGNIPFPTQIVVTSRLGNMEHLALKMLTKKLNADEATAFINMAKELQNEADKDNVDAVLQISVNVNSKIYADIRKENPNMCPALRELMKEDLMEERTAGFNACRKEMEAENKALREEIARLRAENAALKKG
ncbi:MAG: hypothetical protein MJ050_06935 [Phascolarctobacterium sp.]|nr:hypothetical protein [Phascolarctobacterium sp.]